MGNENEPFYLSSGFWQGAAAVAAIILSQLPPVRLWFKRPRLQVEPFARIALNQEIGLPMVQWHLSITNTGGRDVRIKRIGLTFKRGTDESNTEARGYFEKARDQQATLLTPFSLGPQEVWGHNIQFLKLAKREDRQEYSKHIKAMRTDLRKKRNGLPKDAPDVEVDPAIVQPFLSLFDANFYWKHGEYEFELQIETDTPRANVAEKYRFTLFESESEELRAHRDGLKFGYGVVVADADLTYHFADITPSKG